jgi:hypothetical protein
MALKPLADLLVSVLKSYPSMFLNPVVSVLYLVVLALVAVQYGRLQSTEERVYGRAQNRALYQTVVSIGLGLFGGLLASILLVVVGVTVSDSGIGYLFPVALALFLVHPRFLCFSYAGGLISMSHLLFGWPSVNVPAIMALVACLHAAEALLIRISGSGCTTPLYIEGKDGTVSGGFSLQRFWPIPLMVLYLVKIPSIEGMQGLIHLPDWWPLVSAPSVPGPGTPVFVTMPLVAALGYGDLSIARSPKDKAKQTAKTLALYSAALLGFSVAASHWSGFSWVAALFAPVAHEVVIQMGAKEELESVPYYTAAPDGVTVMDVFDRAPGKRAGLARGDVIMEVGGVPVRTREELNSALKLSESGPITLKVRKRKHKGVREIRVQRADEPLGIVTAPELGDQPIASTKSAGILLTWLRRLIQWIHR